MMPESLRRDARKGLSVRLLTGCALASVATGLSVPALAQGLQATPSLELGSPTITPGPTSTDVLMRNTETVINWAPFDTGTSGTIDILPVGSTLTFRDPGGSLGEYTVLNRILPVDASGIPVARPIQFNGTVTSTSVNNPGGQIFFYSPTGIIVGPTATFSVGSLILTTNDIAYIGGVGGSIFKPGGLLQFFGPAGSTGFVTIDPGASITASGNNAYVALVAPKVTQGGLVQANGQIAYIAAEQLEMTINGGLFDFRLTVGTEDPNGVIHTGTTTGPASTSAADRQQISMVALPKNAALTMLLGGSVGYTPAASAAVEGSTIVLAAGFDNDSPNAVPTNRDGSITITDAVFSNALVAYATDTVTVAPSGGTIDFQGDTRLYAANRIDVVAQPGETVETAADTDLTLRSGVPGTGGAVDLRGLGGGQINVGGSLYVDATSEAANYDTTSTFLDGTGGTVNVIADGGTISAGNLIQVNASGLGRFGGAAGGDGFGGSIDVQLEQDGVIDAAQLTLLVRGQGGQSDGKGGDGTGGVINILELGGQLDVGIVQAYAGGTGGHASIGGGNGNGGSINIEIIGQAQDIAQLIADASGSAGLSFGTGPSGLATALPDAIRLAVGGSGTLRATNLVSLTANTYSGIDSNLPGFTGQAGGIIVEVTDGATLSANLIEAHADAAFTGDLPAGVADITPTQQGGTVDITVDGGTIAAGELVAAADAYGRAAITTAGIATGGTATVSSLNGGLIDIRDPMLLEPGTMTVSARGFGEAGFNPSDAVGGTARLIAQDGTIASTGDITVTATGSHREVASVFGGDGQDAQGGTASVELQAGALGTASITADNLNVLAGGDARLVLLFGSGAVGGDEIFGNGGTGSGGTASVTVDAGLLTVGDLAIDTAGLGGTSAAIDSLTAFQSGDGIGGVSTLVQNGGTANVTNLNVTSLGQGGGGGAAAGGSTLAAFAGEGIGGTARAVIAGGALTATATVIDASGTGGAGMSHDGSGDATDGGDGNGGIAVLEAPGGAAGSITTGSLAIRSNGTGGTGGTAASGTSGNGGNGFAQSASADLADGAFSLGAATIEAIGTGGTGVTGGTGTGGLAQFLLNDTAAGPTGARSLAGLAIDSSGVGAGGSAGTPGRSNLEVNTLDLANAVTIAGDVTLTNLGTSAVEGDGITATVSGAALVAGGNIAMTTVRDLTIAAGPGLLATGTVDLDARMITSTGLVGSGAAMSVVSATNIAADGLSSGGTTLLQALNGTIVVADLLSTGAVTATGRAIDIGSSGALQFAAANATAGDLSIGTAGNLGVTTGSATGSLSLRSTTGGITGGNLTAGTWLEIDGALAVALGDLTAAIDVTVAARGGNLTVGNVTAGDEIWLSIFGTNATRVLTAGNLTSTGLGADGAAGPPAVFGAYPGGAGPTGNVTRVRSSGSIALGNVTTPGRTILVADAGTMTAGAISAPEAVIALGRGDIGLGSIATNGLFYVADSTMFLPNLPDAYDPASIAGLAPVRTAGGLTVGGAVNAGSITIGVGGTATAPSWITPGRLLVDAGGQFNATGTTSAGANVSITADSGIGLGTLTSGGTTLLRAINGAVGVTALTSPGAVTALGRSVSIVSPGALAFADLDATAGGASVQTAGSLTVSTADATGAVTLTSTGGNLLTTGAVNGGSIALTAGGTVQANAALTATGALAVDAGGTFTLGAVGRGATVSVTSNDVALGNGAALGARGQTTAVTLINRNPARTTFVGGASNASGYSLDQAELIRLFSDGTILIGTALAGPLPAGQGTVVIDDFRLAFGTGAGTNIGTGGELEISTQGRISVIGDVDLLTSSATDTFTLDPSRIELDTSLGSIAMLNAGNPLGRLVMTGDTVAVGTTAALAQLATLTDFAAIKALLDQPGGNPLALRAGTMTFNVNGGLFIQNSGATALYRDRRGFTSNGTVAINTGSAATRISVNGQILTPSGPLLGLDTQSMVAINGAAAAAGGQFDPASTINGCVIGSRCAPPPGSNPPSDQDLNGPVPSDTGTGALGTPLIELAGTEPLIAPPLVDEPITGVGNDDLWQPRCNEEDEVCPESDSED